jgi:hypothetical protein
MSSDDVARLLMNADQQQQLAEHIMALHGLTIGLLDEFDPQFLLSMPSQFTVFHLHQELAKYLDVPFPFADQEAAEQAGGQAVLEVTQAFLRELIKHLAARFPEEPQDA